MARVPPTADIHETRVTSEPLSELPSPPSRRAYGAGDLIDGKFRLEERIGSGGMGEVWTARNDTLGVRRAVKLIRADCGSAESTDRLLHEARTAARLADPAIVRVFDFGRTEHGDPYILMEMLEGEDLMSIMQRRERLNPTKAVRILLPVIRALGAAHQHGIVHRDLKPENIFLERLADRGVQPKLLDFGIAKLEDARDLRLTSAGSVMGSPLYMAPEQARGEEVDGRADIWALCVVLYEAITGQTPFGGDNRAQVMKAVATLEPEHPSRRGVEEPVPWAILQRGLQKQREDRWSSMEELGQALAQWLIERGVSEDVTGAALEASWFRARRSVLASSVPPERELPRARTTARRGLASRLLGARALGAGRAALRTRLAARLERLDRKKRWAVLGAMAATLAVAVSIGSTPGPVSLAPERAAPGPAAPGPTPPPGRVSPALTEPPLAPAAPGPATPATAPVPAEASARASAPAPEPSSPPPALATRKTKRAGTLAPRRTPRRPARETPAGARRAKLIDPYP